MIFAQRSRHIEYRYHYIRQQVWAEKLKVITKSGKDNPADILMKLLSHLMEVILDGYDQTTSVSPEQVQATWNNLILEMTEDN